MLSLAWWFCIHIFLLSSYLYISLFIYSNNNFNPYSEYHHINIPFTLSIHSYTVVELCNQDTLLKMELVYYVMRGGIPEVLVTLHRWAAWSTTWPSWNSHQSCSYVSATTTRLATEGSGFKRRTSWTQCHQHLKRYSCGLSERRFCLEVNIVKFKPLFIILLFLG